MERRCSPAAINRFLRCPRQFFYAEVLGVYPPPSLNDRWGERLFAALISFHRRHPNLAEADEETLAAALDEAWSTAWEAGDPVNFGGPLVAESYRRRGKERLRAYLRGERQRQEPGQRILALAHPYQLALGEWTIAGTLDRVDQRRFRTVEVVLYETAADAPASEVGLKQLIWSENPEHPPQDVRLVVAYLAAVAETDPEAAADLREGRILRALQRSRVRFLSVYNLQTPLKHGEFSGCPAKLTFRTPPDTHDPSAPDEPLLTVADLEVAAYHLYETLDRMSTEVYPPAPADPQMCLTACPYAPACPQAPIPPRAGGRKGGSPRAGGRKGGSPFLKSQRGSRAPGKLGNLEIAPLSHPAFRILNDAVTFPTDRPLKVVGEAGSGKTLAIVRRFEHLIQEGLAPAHILVVVPSPLATHRLHQLLVTANEPPAPPRPPNIGTVGQHCERFLSQWAEQGVPVTMKTLATPADQRFLFRQALQDVLYLRQGSGNYLRACRHLDFAALASWTVPLQQFIESLKDLGITPDDFEAQARAGHRSTYERLRQALREVLAVESLAPGAKRALKTRLTQWLPPQAAEEEEFIGFLAAVYRAYQTALRQAGLGEDADLVAEVERVFRERPDLQTQVREEVRYLLVDDWHNSTPMHWRWLRLFAADERLSNVTVTGNPQQRLVTGEFDGLAAFTAEAWGGKTVPLSVSLRCPAPILAAARYEGRGTKDEGRGESSSLDLQSSSPAPVIHLIEAPSPEDEATALATEVKRLIEAGQPPEGLAILLRSLRHAPRYERALRAIGVPVNVAGGLGEQYAWQQVLAYLRLLADPSDDLAALTVLTGPPWQGDDETLTRQYVTTSTRQRPNTPQGWWREVLAGQPALRQCWEKLMTLQGKPDWDERVTLLMEITGLRAHWHTLPSPLREQALSAAERLLAWARNFARWRPAGTWEELLAYMQSAQEVVSEEEPPVLSTQYSTLSTQLSKGVHLLTIEQAQGREFDVVWVANAGPRTFPLPARLPTLAFDQRDGLLLGTRPRTGGRRLKFDPTKLNLPEEVLQRYDLRDHAAVARAAHFAAERRLWYVALTRARKCLYLSTSHFLGEEARGFFAALVALTRLPTPPPPEERREAVLGGWWRVPSQAISNPWRQALAWRRIGGEGEEEPEDRKQEVVKMGKWKGETDRDTPPQQLSLF